MLLRDLFETLEETNVRPPESPAKEKYLSTVCDVVEIYSKALKETNVRDPVSVANEKYLRTVCDVVEIYSKAPKETIVRVLRVFVPGDKPEKQETQAKISIQSSNLISV